MKNKAKTIKTEHVSYNGERCLVLERYGKKHLRIELPDGSKSIVEKSRTKPEKK